MAAMLANMKRTIVAVLLIAGAATGVAGCASAPPKPPSVTLSGKMVLEWDPVDSPFNWSADGSKCWGVGEYASVKTGANVTVKDAVGKIVQLVPLSTPNYNPDTVACVYPFHMKVPGGSKFYTVTVAGKSATVRASQMGDVVLTVPIGG